MHCKPFPLRNGAFFHKGDFRIDLERGAIRCPNDVEVPLVLGATAHFPASACGACPKRAACTRAKIDRGRSLTIHANEPFFIELRKEARSAEGRRNLRKRVAVEHSLAAVHHRQGDRARYRGLRKNLFDLRRCAAVTNLTVLDQLNRLAA